VFIGIFPASFILNFPAQLRGRGITKKAGKVGEKRGKTRDKGSQGTASVPRCAAEFSGEAAEIAYDFAFGPLGLRNKNRFLVSGFRFSVPKGRQRGIFAGGHFMGPERRGWINHAA
jgi:hypothetical protein